MTSYDFKTFTEKHDIFVEDTIDLEEGCNIAPKTYTKRKDHSQFKDVVSFTLTDLPMRYLNMETLKLVQCVAELTVRIQIPVENPDNYQIAPQYWQGTGKIIDVIIPEIRHSTCRCNVCLKSDDRSQEWDEVRITTSANLVSQNKCAENYICTLFYDDEKRRGNIKYLNGKRVLTRSVKKDTYTFTCVTCDMELLSQLVKQLDTFAEIWKSAFEKNIVGYRNIVGCENKSAIIVSHIHSCKNKYLWGLGTKIQRKIELTILHLPVQVAPVHIF